MIVFFLMGSFGTIQEKSLLQDATVSMIKTVPVMMNMYFPNGRLLKNMGLFELVSGGGSE